MNTSRPIATLAAGLLLVVACSGNAPPTLSPTAQPSPTLQPAPTPSATQTQAPTSTQAPTPAPTPQATSAVSIDGAYLTNFTLRPAG